MTQHTDVPHLVGLTVPQARATGHGAGVVVTSRDVDGPPLGERTWPGTWIVTAQDPTAGERVRRGTAVVIDFEEYPDAGGAGDREPRHPLPSRDTFKADPAEDRAEGTEVPAAESPRRGGGFHGRTQM